jgi:predicted phage tail protein
VSTNGLVTVWNGAGQNFAVAPLSAPTATPISSPQTTDQPAFAWTAPTTGTPPASYEVWITDRTTGQVQTVSGITATSLAWPPAKALSPGDKFTWWVGSVSTNGLVTFWNGAGQYFAVAPMTAPTATPISSPQTTDQPAFAWSAPTTGTPPGSYEVWITDTTAGKVVTFPNLTTTSFTVPSAKALTSGHSFTWWVGSVSTNGLIIVWDVGQNFTVT